MSEITKVTTPLIPKENLGSKNRPQTEQTFEINNPSRVNKPLQESKIRDGEAGGQALRENLGKAIVQPLLRDSGDLMYNIRKMITLLELGISTSDLMQSPEVKELLENFFAPPEEMLEQLMQQDEASVLFRGESFDVLRDVAQRFQDNPRIQDALVEMLKVFEHNVNAQNSIKTILLNCNNLLDYMFTRDREQFSEYLENLADMILPEGAQYIRDGNPNAEPGQVGTGLDSTLQAMQQAQQGSRPELQQDLREVALILKNNLLPLLGEVVVKYHQNEKIRDIVMVVVHNIVRVDRGTPEALRDAIDHLVSELNKAANLPENFGRSLLSSVRASAEEAKHTRNDVIAKLAGSISETLHSRDVSPNLLRQAENMLISLLQNQSSMMNVLHFMLPMEMEDDRVFAELYVDPESDEKNRKDSETTRKIFLSAESEKHGSFELCFWQNGERVDFSLWCPNILVAPMNTMKRQLATLMQVHGFTMSSFRVEEFVRPHTIADVFPKLLGRRVGIDVKI